MTGYDEIAWLGFTIQDLQYIGVLKTVPNNLMAVTDKAGEGQVVKLRHG